MIVPALLATTFEEFQTQFNKVQSFAPYLHIDVMDGKFVPNTSFQEIDRLKELKTDLRFELHLMVNDPIGEMRKWQTIENVFRVLFHIEAPTDPLRTLTFMKKEGWERGMVLNPETPLNTVEKFLDKLDVLQFMTVHPGRQGAPFQKEILFKIEQFIKSRDSLDEFTELRQTPAPLCAADGAVNKDTIPQLRKAGVEIFNVGSALTQSENVLKTYEELQLSLRGGTTKQSP